MLKWLHSAQRNVETEGEVKRIERKYLEIKNEYILNTVPEMTFFLAFLQSVFEIELV